MKQEGCAARCDATMRADNGTIVSILGETPTYRSERDCRCRVFVFYLNWRDSRESMTIEVWIDPSIAMMR